LVDVESSSAGAERKNVMLWTLAIVFLVLWGVGLVTHVTIGGFIHVLLLLAIVTVVLNLVRGRRVV
jgi:hypothetical protein